MMSNRRTENRSRVDAIGNDWYPEQAIGQEIPTRRDQTSRFDPSWQEPPVVAEPQHDYASEFADADRRRRQALEIRRAKRAIDTQVAKQQKKKRRVRGVVFALLTVLLVAVGGVSWAYFYMQGISSNLHQGLDPNLQDVLVKTDLSNEPFYMVLIGTDGSAVRDENGQFGGSYRSDSLMLARIDPVNKKVVIISICRDTLIDIPGYGKDKINAAYAYGGPSLTVQVMSELCGVPISHYAEVNFDGFEAIVDSLGGVDIDVPIEIDDYHVGGHLDAGPQTLNGDQALMLARSRHSYDDIGKGDFFRAANQRLVLSAIVKKILSADLRTMTSVLEELSKNVLTTLSIQDIIGLAQTMRGLDTTNDLSSASQPTSSLQTAGGWYEITIEDEWRAMMDRVRAGLPPTEETIIDPISGTLVANAGIPAGTTGVPDKAPNAGGVMGHGSVMVKNGSGGDGVATTAGDRLVGAGYSVETGNADSYNYPTTLVIYNSADQAGEAQNIANVLGVGKVILNDGTYTVSNDFLVVIGADF